MAAAGVAAAARCAVVGAGCRAAAFFFRVSAPLRRPSRVRRRTYRNFVITFASASAVTRQSLISATAAGIFECGNGVSDTPTLRRREHGGRIACSSSQQTLEVYALGRGSGRISQGRATPAAAA
eukprot:6965030-Prymnesium_polylepis.1